MRDKILQLLGSGVEIPAVALAVGVTTGYISQLLAEPEFALRVSELRLIELTQAKQIDDTWDNIELELVKKLKELIPFFSSTRHILDALKVVNSAKRKTKMNAGYQGSGINGNVVSITLPAITVNQYKINMIGGMTEVAGRKLKALDSAILLKTLEERREHGKEPELLEAPSSKSREKIVSADSV